MSNNQYQSGYVEFEQGHMPISQLDSFGKTFWDDGNVAWSRGEKRWREAEGKSSFSELFANKRLNEGGVEGFAMEADLWRYSKSEGVAEELVIEREDDRFFYQRWTLYPEGKKEEKDNCFWKNVRVILRPHLKLFNANNMECIEVIQPEHRLHTYLTRGEGQG